MVIYLHTDWPSSHERAVHTSTEWPRHGGDNLLGIHCFYINYTLTGIKYTFLLYLEKNALWFIFFDNILCTSHCQVIMLTLGYLSGFQKNWIWFCIKYPDVNGTK